MRLGRRERTGAALIASICGHLVVVILLLTSLNVTPFGSTAPINGNGSPDAVSQGKAITLTLVSPAIVAPESDRSAVLSPLKPAKADDLRRVAVLSTIADLDAGSKSSSSTTAMHDDPSPSPAKTPEQARRGQLTSLAAQAEDGGELNGATSVLEQIAKCLPPGVRPSFPFASLELVLDDRGGLRAPPHIRLANPLTSAADVLSADYVVQAALQCGPYSHAVRETTLSLAVDFSKFGKNTGPPTARFHTATPHPQVDEEGGQD